MNQNSNSNSIEPSHFQPPLRINGTLIEDTFAEGFSMRFARLVVTAWDEYWLKAGLAEFCGYGTSVIGCDAEVGIERFLEPAETPDGRVGANVLAFGFSSSALGDALVKRTGQCLMTCPTTAVYDGLAKEDWSVAKWSDTEDEDLDDAGKDLAADENETEPERAEQDPAGKRVALGQALRFFGDGYQKSKLLGARRFWRVPVMDGEFIVEDSVSIGKGVAGGNFLIQSVDQASGLSAARHAVESIEKCNGVITPFPAGVVRSGSKVGSRYKKLVASTYDSYCPSLRAQVESRIHPDANCVYEIVIDGVNFRSVSLATRAGIVAACGAGIVAIAAGNYGGNLGPHHFHLLELMRGTSETE